MSDSKPSARSQVWERYPDAVRLKKGDAWEVWTHEDLGAVRLAWTWVRDEAWSAAAAVVAADTSIPLSRL